MFLENCNYNRLFNYVITFRHMHLDSQIAFSTFLGFRIVHDFMIDGVIVHNGPVTNEGGLVRVYNGV